ncbi:uncharacterized protein [Haliotis cracherodii]|uniref:uncharacterized protein n=1 Tax=Haliotis cracherodii TaxID=6455 RepID=UPI0039ECD3C4
MFNSSLSMRHLFSRLLFFSIVFWSEFQDCHPAKAPVITAPVGGTVTLSWKRPRSVRQYIVRNAKRKEDVFHIKFDRVNVVNAGYKSRTWNTSSTEGMVSVVLQGVKWTDAGRYKCFRGPPRRRPRDLITKCGLELVVIDIQDPYIAARDTYELSQYNGSVNLSCIIVTNATSSYPGEASFIWRRNGSQVDGETEHHTSVRDGVSGSQLRVDISVLTTASVAKGDEVGRYTCQARVGQQHQTVPSEEFALDMDTWPDVYTNYAMLGEGDKATLTWTLPQPRPPFLVTSPSGTAILDVDAASIYLRPHYRPRVKIAGVLTTDDFVAVQLIFHTVRGYDAGRYSCEAGGNVTLTDWENFLYVSRKPRDPTISNVDQGQGVVLSCASASQTLPHNNPDMLSYSWRRNSSDMGLEVFHSVNPTLNISSTTKDGDHYSCQAAEQGLVSPWSAEFVLRKPIVPTITSAGSHKEVILTCVSSSLMSPDAFRDVLSYRWKGGSSHLENGRMTKGAALNISSHPGRGEMNTGATLTLSTATQGDQYTCQAVEQGLYSDWSEVYVLHKPTIKRLTHDAKSSIDPKPDDVTFTCEVDGTPPLSVSLIRRSKDGDTVLGSTTTYTSRMVAFNVGKPSLGEYLCSASNVVGHDDGSTSSFLKSRLYRQNDEDITLKTYTSHAVGTFYLWGYPKPSNTRLSCPDGQTGINISGSQKYILSTSNIEDNQFMVTFTINKVEQSDEGIYTISFDNGQGSLDVSVELFVPDGEKVVIVTAVSVVVVGIIIVSIFCLAFRKLTESRKGGLNVSGLGEVTKEPGPIVTIGCRDLQDKDTTKGLPRLPPDIGMDAQRMSFYLHRVDDGNYADDERTRANFIASVEASDLL